MKRHKEPRNRAGTNENPLAHIGWREQLGIGLLFALAALIFVPTFWRGLACGHDTLIHFYRVVQMAFNVQDGMPFTLWGQHFMRGYGYTIYPFYAPLMYWLTTAIHFLGLDFSPALRLAVWLMLFLAGWGGYNLGRRYFKPTGAFVVGLAYLFAPYMIYNATQRGAFPELLSLALLPWALTAADLAIFRRTPRSLVTAVFLFSLVMLSHNIVPNFGFLILLGLALSRSQSLKPRAVWQVVWPALTIIGLTLLVTSFFWLPAYVELDFTQTRREDSPFSFWPRFEQHFIRGDELAGVPEEPADPALTNPPTSIKIGAGQALLAGIAILLTLAVRAYRRPWLWLWALITVFCLFLATRASLPLWATLPLPEFVQLPTRFFGPASLGVAVLVGVVGDWLGRHIEAAVWPQDFHLNLVIVIGLYVLSAVLVAASGWFWLYPVLCEAPVQPTASTVAQATSWQGINEVLYWGGDSAGETLPRWVDVLPDPNVFMPAYEAGEEINRLALPETAVLLDWETHANGDSYRLQLAEAQTLTYRSFYAPYWRAEINGEPVLLTPKPVDGLIQVAVPAGEVALTFTFGPTPLRVVTLIISGLTAVVLIWWGRRSGPFVPPLSTPAKQQWVLFGSIVVVLWLAFAYVNLTNNAIRADRFVGRSLQGVDHPAQIPFEGEFVFLGYSGPDRVPADQTFRLTQYWTPDNEIGMPYRFRLRITDDAGNVWHLPYGLPYSATFLPGKPGWQVGRYARDAYEFNMLPGTPPGLYWLETSVFRSDTDLSLMPRQAETAVDPAWARVGQIEVTAGEWQPTAETAQVDTFMPTPIASVPSLTLLGWSLPDVVWQPGQQTELDLLWQGDQTILDEQVVADLWLVDETGEQVAQTAVPVGSEVYPLASGAKTASTEPAEVAVVRNQIQWRLPPGLETGVHTVWLSVGEQAIELGAWQINAPERTFATSEVDITSDFQVDFGKLVGYSLVETAASAGSVHAVAPGEVLELELVWQATAETPTNYRVFVHLLDETGKLVAQSDAVPDNWTRPTTGWIPGEYIRDRHTLTLPADAIPGDYTLVVGFYETATGSRLGEAEIGSMSVSGE